MRHYFIFILLLAIPAVKISARQGSASWFYNSIHRVETKDTVGQMNEFRNPQLSSAPFDRQLRNKIAYCYFAIYYEHDLPYAEIQECMRLDSALGIDSLHTLARFIEGYYWCGMYNYPISLEILNEVALAANNKAGTLIEARCFMQRSYMLQTMGYPEEAQKSVLVALEFYERNQYMHKVGAIYNNLSLGAHSRSDSVTAFRYMNKSIAIRDSMNDLNGLGQSYNNLGTIYTGLGKYDSALTNFRRGYEYRKRGGASYRSLLESRINIGSALYNVGKAQEAIDSLEVCYAASLEKTHFELRRRIADVLRKIYFETGNYKRAYELQAEYYQLQDTLYDRSMKEELVRKTVEYDFRAKEQEAAIRQQERENRAKVIMNALTIGLLLAAIMVYSLIRSNRQKKKSNAIITSQRDILDKKQQEITESIRYARFIQQTLLPLDSTLKSNLGEYFVLYLPKDIVSGDFYWMKPSGEQFLFAVADCTGHGVPGAFMSLLAKENIDKAAGISDSPGEILANLNRAIKFSLHQGQGQSDEHGLTLQDGLDIAMIRKDATTITYAGANRPLWIYRSNGRIIEEHKATKAAIGGITSTHQTFSELQLKVDKGDILFLFTDGFADQFGGDNKKKLTTKKFRELLLRIAPKPISEQENELRSFLLTWRGNEEQVDDILLVGIKI